MGLHRARLGSNLTGRDEDKVRRARENLGVSAVFRRLDTCAAESSRPQTPYMYSTYEALPAMERCRGRGRRGGEEGSSFWRRPNRIAGHRVDYCCVTHSFESTEAGYETINGQLCKPETDEQPITNLRTLYFERSLRHVIGDLRASSPMATLSGVNRPVRRPRRPEDFGRAWTPAHPDLARTHERP